MEDKLPRGLYALVDDVHLPRLSLAAKVAALAEGGVRVFQLRLKGLSPRAHLEAARQVVGPVRQAGAVLLINDAVDVALVSGADGVHLGEADLPVAAARKVLGPGALIGATCRSLEDVRRARAEGADHVGVGPLFPSPTKRVEAPLLSLPDFAALCAASPLPVVGISGITLQTVGQVARAGARCAAVASALYQSEGLARAARSLQARFDSGL
jgi:thiamine-phosphate pyrophosphorylase